MRYPELEDERRELELAWEKSPESSWGIELLGASSWIGIVLAILVLFLVFALRLEVALRS